MNVSQRQLQSLYKGMLASFINAGYIDPTGKSPEEIHQDLCRVADDLPDDFDVVIDHTPQLLSLARQFRRSSKPELAVLMYATWVEHSLNLILHDLATAASIGEKYVRSMIRESSARAKATWLLGLIGGRPLSPSALARMQKLFDARNAFVHYKWGQLSKKAKADQEAALVDADYVIRAVQRIKRLDLGRVSKRSKVVQSVLPKHAKPASTGSEVKSRTGQ